MTHFKFLCSALLLTLLIALSAAKPITPPARLSTPTTPSRTCVLPASSSLTTDRTGSTTASLEWLAVTGAVSYSLKVYELNTNVLVSNTVEQSTSTTVSGLDPGKNYRAVLAAMCSGGNISEFVIVEGIVD